MNNIADLVSVMERIAPTRLAAEWDNVGLLLGDARRPLKRIFVCLDVVMHTVDEAIAAEADAIVSYHPVLFNRPNRITTDDSQGRALLALMEARMAVYSPHTAWDAAENGLADWLAKGIGDGKTRPIESTPESGGSPMMSIVTFVPRDATEAVRDAMAAAGAGRVGRYACCSTRIDTLGSFRPMEGADPTIGSVGQLEQVEEHRLQMVCGDADLPAAVSALRAAHPYEEPPVQIFELKTVPTNSHGAGRIVEFESPQSLAGMIERLKTHLGVSSLRASIGLGSSDNHHIAGCCPGAGGSMLSAAESAGASIFVTGEMRHHDLLAARERGLTVLLAGHAHTEQGGLGQLASAISHALPDVDVRCSQHDASPWSAV
ncbi:MAG: Nif3-like dinuclear metal center hexameric protein [Phycisphaerales bacterium]|nr:Nif3-like dinuclear metal center hexameric protein [Phycisphaerales bacterium]